MLELNDIDSDKLFRNYFSDILHLLRTKDWATLDLLQDIMELMEALVATRDNLREINKNIMSPEKTPKSKEFFIPKTVK